MPPIRSEYACRACGNIQKFDVPDNMMQNTSFAETPQDYGHNISCDRCGLDDQMYYRGPA